MRSTATKAPYGQKQYGGTLGGPIEKDQTFYFLVVRAARHQREQLRHHRRHDAGDSTPARTSARRADSPATPVSRCETGNLPYRIQSNQFLGKVDHTLNTNNLLTTRFNWAKDLNENIEPFGGIVARSRGAVLNSHDVMVAASETSVRSSKMVNELRFQFAARDQTVRSLDPLCGGECTLENQGGPTLEVLGVASVGRQRFTPQPRKNTRYQVLDTLSYYTGPHQLKAGFDFNYIDQREQSLPLHFGGRYIFAAIPAAQAPQLWACRRSTCRRIVAVRLGIPGRYVQGYGNSLAPYTYKDFSLFAQDDWRVTPRLTAKFGLRYQMQMWPDVNYTVSGYPNDVQFSRRWQQRRAAARCRVGSARAIARRRFMARTASTSTTSLPDSSASPKASTAGTACGRSSPPLPADALQRGTHQGAGCRSRRRRIRVSSSRSILGSKHPTPIIVVGGVARELPGQMSLSADIIYVRGFKQPSTLDYNPLVPSLGRWQTSGRRERCGRHVGLRASVHLVRRDVVPRPDGVGSQTLRQPPSVDGELHAVESGRQRHRLSE